jgi:putative FmdB family regulatory protein
MPIFEYICSDCSQHFEALVRNGRSATCPACNSSQLQKQLSVFSANVSGGGERMPEAQAAPCMSCGDPRGPEACSLN